MLPVSRQHACIPLYTATDGQQTGNNFVAFNMLLVTSNMLLEATCCLQHVACCQQHVVSNMLRATYCLVNMLSGVNTALTTLEPARMQASRHPNWPNVK